MGSNAKKQSWVVGQEETGARGRKSALLPSAPQAESDSHGVSGHLHFVPEAGPGMAGWGLGCPNEGPLQQSQAPGAPGHPDWQRHTSDTEKGHWDQTEGRDGY